MKLLRFGEKGQEKPGILDENNQIRDLSSIIGDLDVHSLSQALIDKINTLDLSHLKLIDPSVRLGHCVNVTGKLICVGYNSKLHNQQMGAQSVVSHEIVAFLKANSAISGPRDPIIYTHLMQKLDWEAELGVVIGKQGKYISLAEADDYIFGYTCINDLSERHWQFEKEDKQYCKGKSFDSCAPIGPYLVTKDAIADPSNLKVKLWVNDEIRQNFNTGEYIHSPRAVISYLSQFFTLYPGDVISMGSGPGNASAWDYQYLQPGDKLVLEIDLIGRQEQCIEQELRA